MLFVVAMGVVVLFGFFAILGLFSPTEVLWLSIAVGVLAILFMIRSLWVRRHLGTHGNHDLFRSVNRLRERRGF
jgi:tetrahydromethanopterin S-methyltransferase subunit C